MVQSTQDNGGMLAGPTAINFGANVFSAVFGLLNVVIFTRLFAPAEFGTYVLGVGFAGTASIFLTSWLRLPILREQSRGDGTDVRGIVLPGFFLSCLAAPLAYGAARGVGLAHEPALAAVGLALAVGFFETGQELMRARLAAFTLMKATMVRAVLVPTLGVASTLAGQTGVLLLVSSTLAYLVAAVAFTHETWLGATLRFDGARLKSLAKAGLPLTLSLTLLAISSVIDRFIVAHLAGAALAGQYAVGVDLVRQTLIIPALSAATAFVPMAVQILAKRGETAVRAHLDECFELLLAISLPACFGFAIVSPHIANAILGPEFRELATQVMPIVSIGVVFQILTYQYLHTSFLLSNRNGFYLVNTGSVIAFNAILSYVLIGKFGALGAAWGRFAAEVFGFASALILVRWAFPVPLPFRRMGGVLAAAATMAIAIKGLDAMLATSSRNALLVLIPAGVAVYALMCWLLDVAQARSRATHYRLVLRNAAAQLRSRRS